MKKGEKMNNDQYCTVVSAFSKAGKGTFEFFNYMEEQFTDSPIPFEIEHYEKVL